MNQEKLNGKSKPLALTKSFTKKCKNLKIHYGWGNVQSRKPPLRKCLVGEVSVGDLSLGKCQSGNCPVGKVSYNPSNCPLARSPQCTA